MGTLPRLGDKIKIDAYDELGEIVAFEPIGILVLMPWRSRVLASYGTTDGQHRYMMWCDDEPIRTSS
jgi:hypothetical protein